MPTDAELREEVKARIGTVLRGKWTVDRLIDTGGMAAVYAATHRNGNRVAVKMLHRHLSNHADLRDRFLREGYVANKVGHPGAVLVLDDDALDDGSVFLVMELLEGESLEGRMSRAGLLKPIEALFAAEQILDVLAAAHEKGIIHRDVKPANVFVTKDGRVKLLDFGLARVRELGNAKQIEGTRDGVVMGTAAFMPPEQALGKTGSVEPTSDQWAVGALVFTALSGKFVHEARSAVDRLLKAATSPARSLADVLPDAPKDVVAIVDRALSFEKKDRFPDTRAMQNAVRASFHRFAATPSAANIKVAAPVAADPWGASVALAVESVAHELEHHDDDIEIPISISMASSAPPPPKPKK